MINEFLYYSDVIDNQTLSKFNIKKYKLYIAIILLKTCGLRW